MVRVKMDEDCQFLKDLTDKSKEVPINRGMYNLICSKRDLKLYTKGIKPHRNWKIGDVKKYFGIKGNADSVLDQILFIDRIVKQEV